MQKSNSKQSSFSNENNKTQEMKTFRMQTGSSTNASISKRQFSLLRNKYNNNDLRNNNFDGTTSLKTTYSTDEENENFGYKNFGDQNSDEEYGSQEEYGTEEEDYDEDGEYNNHFHKYIHIEDLPDDILFLIFLFLLGSKDRRNICMDITLVCKKWASVLLDDRFWRQACISYRVPFDTTPGFILFTNQQRQLQQQFVENNILNASSSPSSFPFNFSDSKANVLSHRFHSTTDLTNIQQYSRPPRMNQIVKVQSDFPPQIESYQEYSYSSTSNNNTNVNFGSSTFYSSNNSPVSTSSSSSNNEPTSPMPPIPKNNSSAVNSSLNQSKRKTSTPNIFSPIPNISSPIQDDNDYFDDDKSVESQFSQESDPNYSNSRRIRKRRDSFFRDIFMENRYHKCWASEKVVDFLNSKAYNLRNHEIGYTKLYYCYPFIILGFLREFQFYLYPKFGDGYDDYQQKYFRDLLQYSKKLPPEAEEASQNATDSPSVPSANDENIDENFSFGNSQESTTSSSSFHQSSSKSGIPNFTDELMLNHICTFTCIDPVVKLDVDYREEINETNIVAFTSGGFELFTLPKDKANLDYKYRKGGLQNIDLNANVGDASLVPIPCNAGRIDFGEYTQDDIAIVHTMAGKIFALFKLSREDPSIVSGPHVRIWDFNTRKLLHRVPLPPNKIVFGLEPWNARELFDFKGSNKVGAIADIVGKVVYLLDLATLDWATIESPKGEPSFVRTNGNSVLIFGADPIRARAKSSAFLDLWSYKPLNNSSKNNNKNTPNTTNNTGNSSNNNNNNISITINNNSTANTNNNTSTSGNQSNININITVANTNPNSNITITNTTTTTTTSISSSTTFVNPPPPPSSQNQPFVKECILSLEYEHIIAAHVDANRVYVLLKPYSKNTIYLDIWDNSDGSFVCRVKSFDDVNGFFDKRDFDKKYIRIMKSDERNLYYYVIQFKPNIGSILSIRQIASIPLYCLPSKELQPHQPIHQVEESFKRKYSLPGLAGLAQFISPQTPNNNVVANLKKDRSRSFSIKFAPRPEERGRRASIISTEGL